MYLKGSYTGSCTSRGCRPHRCRPSADVYQRQLVYFALALLVLIVNIQKVPEMFALIFSRAFDFKAVGGAAIGTVIYQGLKRGVFSNGAGQGDAPTAGASAEVSHPAKQGLFGVFSVFIDTILVCTLTAFVIIISGDVYKRQV